MSRAEHCIWTTKDGRKMRVVSMDDAHLANSCGVSDRRLISSMEILPSCEQPRFFGIVPISRISTMRGARLDVCREILEEEAARRGLHVEFAAAVDRDGKLLYEMMYASDPYALRRKYGTMALGQVLDGTPASVEVFRDRMLETYGEGDVLGEALATGHDPFHLLPRVDPYANALAGPEPLGWFVIGEALRASIRASAAALRGGESPVCDSERMFVHQKSADGRRAKKRAQGGGE